MSIHRVGRPLCSQRLGISAVQLLNAIRSHGRPQGVKTGVCPPLEIGTKKQKFLENVKSAF